MYRVSEIASEVDLANFSRWLDSQGVLHRFSEEGGHQVLWVEDERAVISIKDVLDRYVREPDLKNAIDQGVEFAPQMPRRAGFVTTYPRPSFNQAPFVFICIAIACLVALLTSFGEGGAVLRFFLIVDPFNVDADLNSIAGRFEGLWELLSAGQFWRIIGPDFIHFHVPHLAFNMLLFWLFGGQLEKRFGLLWFVCFFVFVSAVSNIAQLVDTGYLFGGMSGVAYGIVGFCWLAHKQGMTGLYFPPAIFNISVLWLVLGYTPIFESLGMGSMANSAHLFGLVAGLGWAKFKIMDR